jgi:hypothetical protein
LDASAKTMRAGLLKRDEGERGRDYPAGSAGYPAPTELAWIELHVVVDSAEFPAPQPVRFPASRFQQPPNSAIHTREVVPGSHQA